MGWKVAAGPSTHPVLPVEGSGIHFLLRDLFDEAGGSTPVEEQMAIHTRLHQYQIQPDREPVCEAHID